MLADRTSMGWLVPELHAKTYEDPINTKAYVIQESRRVETLQSRPVKFI